MKLALSTAGTFLPGYGVGLSDESRRVTDSLRDAIEHILDSQSAGAQRAETLEALNEAFSESLEEDWDGYGALPARRGSYFEAKRFISMLPTTISEPDVGFDPEGNVELNWFGQEGLFSLTVTESSLLVYAGSFPLRRFRGSEYLGNEVSKTILRHIETLAV